MGLNKNNPLLFFYPPRLYDELPADIRELYDYNPEKAKQLLAEAGYPNGFEIEFLQYSRTEDIDACQNIIGQLKEIGIDYSRRIMK